MTMKTKMAFLATLILFHFSVIVIGVVKPNVDASLPVWQVLNWYGKITGASASYSFFSPNIPREVVFQFTIHNKDKTVLETTLQKTANNEVNARVGNILRMVPRSFKSKNIVRSLAASLTASMFKTYPEAATIDFKSVIFVLPSMEQYREGERSKTAKLYSASFARGNGT